MCHVAWLKDFKTNKFFKKRSWVTGQSSRWARRRRLEELADIHLPGSVCKADLGGQHGPVLQSKDFSLSKRESESLLCHPLCTATEDLHSSKREVLPV